MFFALWPDQSVRLAIERATRAARRRSGGRPVTSRNLHLTLAFLGAVDRAGLERVRGLELSALSPFELVLDRLGYWRRQRVLWLGCETIPPPLGALERALWQRLGALGFRREARPFVPHLTLCRKARAVEDRVRPVVWGVARFALVESVPDDRGVRYEPRAFWPLTAGAHNSPSDPETPGCEPRHSME